MASTARQVEFLLAGYRNPSTDEPLSGGNVYTYQNGTTTESNLWVDRDKDSQAANPIVLSASGKAEVYGDGVYKFEIYDSTGTHVETINGIELYPAGEGTGDMLESKYDSDGDGVVDGAESLLVRTSTETGDKSLAVTDLNTSIRVNSESSQTMTFPSVDADQDGFRQTFIKIGAGDLVIAASDSDNVADSSSTQITGTSEYAAITLEYVHAVTAWIVISSVGSWSSA